MYSARYAGEDATDLEKIQKLLGELADKNDRSAKFVSSVAFVFPDGSEIVTTGEVCGKITDAPQGDNGFGYDPVFYSTELGKTFAEASAEEKNSISHRGRALLELYDKLKQILDSEE